MKFNGAIMSGYMTYTPAAVDDAVIEENKLWSSEKTVSALAITETKSGNLISTDDSAFAPLRGLYIYGKTTQNGTPTIDSPVDFETVGESGGIDVCITGKNLIPYPYVNKSKTTNGITFTVNKDGSITINGTATANADFSLKATDNNNIMGGYVTASQSGAGTKNNYTLSLQNAAAGMYIAHANAGNIMLRVSAGATVENCTVYPQIEYGNVATEYEPYKKQNIILSTPVGLRGIPVESGGNYTDENGQQWICDEVDFGRGVRVQRVNSVTFDGSSDEVWNTGAGNIYIGIPNMMTEIVKVRVLCTAFTHFSDRSPNQLSADEMTQGATRTNLCFGNPENALTKAEWVAKLAASPITVQYVLAEPIETPLDEETLAAYASLHTNKLNTTVYNDSGAGMALSYVADTKAYIDNKFTELQNAILATGANV